MQCMCQNLLLRIVEFQPGAEHGKIRYELGLGTGEGHPIHQVIVSKEALCWLGDHSFRRRMVNGIGRATGDFGRTLAADVGEGEVAVVSIVYQALAVIGKEYTMESSPFSI